ncbi:MAG: ABC transporter permease, partial [Chloroflexi bacterium]|nr:ABC transporter permease [Chloroflexota bacterium]
MQITLPQTARAIRQSRAPAAIRRLAASLGAEGAIGLALLVAFAIVGISAPLLAPYDPAAFSGAPLERPSADHRLGTNDVGQDILSELIAGARISLAVALGAAGGTVLLAVLIGGAAGYAGGWIDAALMR